MYLNIANYKKHTQKTLLPIGGGGGGGGLQNLPNIPLEDAGGHWPHIIGDPTKLIVLDPTPVCMYIYLCVCTHASMQVGVCTNYVFSAY